MSMKVISYFSVNRLHLQIINQLLTNSLSINIIYPGCAAILCHGAPLATHENEVSTGFLKYIIWHLPNNFCLVRIDDQQKMH